MMGEIMSGDYKGLAINIMPVATQLSIPKQHIKKVAMEDFAENVMTDLNCVCAITIAAGDGLHDAEYKMKNKQVKMLFVVDHNDYVIGILSFRDISGHRISCAEKELGIPASEMCILDIMTGIDIIEVIDYSILKDSKVGNVVETLKQLNRQHILVLEDNNIKQIRGIFSARQIEKQLDIPLNIPLNYKHTSSINDNTHIGRLSA
jgi:CBS-domain-containing membrane protein